MPTSALQISGYHSIRQDRNFTTSRKKRGGGLITYIHQKHIDKIQDLAELSVANSNYEMLWTKLNMPHSKDIIFCNIYRPPSGNLKLCLDHLEICLSSINANKTDIFIMGDINVDHLDKKNSKLQKNFLLLKVKSALSKNK